MTDYGSQGGSGDGSTGDGGLRRRGRNRGGRPKGRHTDPAALAQVQALLGERPRRRDLLIEHLHLLQDALGHLPASHLAALAEDMNLPLAEVWEVATFYHGFAVTGDGETPPAPVEVRVCDSISCALAGADRLIEALRQELGSAVPVRPVACLGRCDGAPAAAIGLQVLAPATAETVVEAVRRPTGTPAPEPKVGFDAYRRDGGYTTLLACREGRLQRDGVLDRLDESGLRGLGGAGFPTGRKWRLVAAQPGPRMMAVNADESEPGTFKDRHYLMSDPHRFLEGMLIGAWMVQAEAIYIYLRDEYPDIRVMLTRALGEIAEAGLAWLPIELRRGAGAYICGEESAMLESIEGRRGLPRHKPPFPSEVGLFGKPTLINNVETLYWVRDLLEKGGAWTGTEGRRGRRGLRSFSVSGRVREPGVKLVPAGTSARELIEEFSGGMQPGHRFRAYLPAGASGGILPASLGDLPLDFGTLEEHGSFIGSAAVIVLSDQDDLQDAALNLMRFFEDESCGQCTPCRVGTEKAVKLMRQAGWDLPLLEELAQVMASASICGLGQAAANGPLSLLRHFPEELGR